MEQRSLFAKVLSSLENDGMRETTAKILGHPIVRHPISTARFKMRMRYITKSSSIEERFTKIFTKKYWGDEESVSGFGSRFAYTANLRKCLPELIKTFSINSIFDAPCGDFYWMNSVIKEVDAEYLGGDIVRPLVDKNNSEHRNSRTNFIHFDITTNIFPRADLWICRDCLFHLSFDDAFQALRRFIESDIPYVLTTTFKNLNGFKNYDIKTGDHRLIDLFAEPFGFDKNALYRIDDYIKPHHPREMCLWSREQIIQSSAMKSFQSTRI